MSQRDKHKSLKADWHKFKIVSQQNKFYSTSSASLQFQSHLEELSLAGADFWAVAEESFAGDLSLA